MILYILLFLLVAITSVLLAYGVICFIITKRSNDATAEGTLQQFSKTNLQFISEQHSMPVPMKLFEFPNEHKKN